ncbi:MAG: trehalose-phosphatase [Pseudomonadota bacterium]
MTYPDILDSSHVAVFLDFDGTLVEIAERPDAVELLGTTRDTLECLNDITTGAVAIVTGREIDFVDTMLSPLTLPVAGVHGLMRRNAQGQVLTMPENSAFIAEASKQLVELTRMEPGLLLERKGVSLALHYRGRPELETSCIETMGALVDRYPDIELKRGKMVLEAKPAGTNKGTAVVDFMSEAPFRGRVPVFAGDDVTDEDAFERVNAMGGLTIKVGDGDTAAKTRVESTAAFLTWLEKSAQSLSGETHT